MTIIGDDAGARQMVGLAQSKSGKGRVRVGLRMGYVDEVEGGLGLAWVGCRGG